MWKPIPMLAAFGFVAVGWLLGVSFGKSSAPSDGHDSVVKYEVKPTRIPDSVRGFDEIEFLKNQEPPAARIEFEGKTFWVILSSYGWGVSHYTVEVYAPTKAGEHRLCLKAQSCGAGHLETELDHRTGILVFREHARSKLEGQVILSCNLRSVGNSHSVSGE